VNKIEKAKAKKRRRPNKKLVANLESLADALPDLDENDDKSEVVVGQAKIHRTSLKSRPGATKRKEASCLKHKGCRHGDHLRSLGSAEESRSEYCRKEGRVRKTLSMVLLHLIDQKFLLVEPIRKRGAWLVCPRYPQTAPSHH
jgi:hypothetical protein